MYIIRSGLPLLDFYLTFIRFLANSTIKSLKVIESFLVLCHLKDLVVVYEHWVVWEMLSVLYTQPLYLYLSVWP